MIKYFLLAGLVIVIVALGLNANTQIRAPKKATPPEGDFMDIEGTRFHYVERGNGPALILIHGAGGSSREWTFSMMDKLVDRYRVIAIDRPGHGYTSRIPSRKNTAETTKEQADLIHAAAKRLDIDQAIVLGQSYGGAVALSFAVHHPDTTAGLVMVAGVSNLWEGELGDWYKNTNTWWGKYLMIPVLSNLSSDKSSQEVFDGIFAPDPAPEGYLAHVGQRLSSRSSQIRANTAQINRSYEDVASMVDRYPLITAPTEIIHGDLDTTVPLTVHSIPLSNQIKGATLTVLKGAGHMPQHSREAEVIAAIDRAAKRAGLR